MTWLQWSEAAETHLCVRKKFGLSGFVILKFTPDIDSHFSDSATTTSVRRGLPMSTC